MFTKSFQTLPRPYVKGNIRLFGFRIDEGVVNPDSTRFSLSGNAEYSHFILSQYKRPKCMIKFSSFSGARYGRRFLI